MPYANPNQKRPDVQANLMKYIAAKKAGKNVTPEDFGLGYKLIGTPGYEHANMNNSRNPRQIMEYAKQQGTLTKHGHEVLNYLKGEGPKPGLPPHLVKAQKDQQAFLKKHHPAHQPPPPSDQKGTTQAGKTDATGGGNYTSTTNKASRGGSYNGGTGGRSGGGGSRSSSSGSPARGGTYNRQTGGTGGGVKTDPKRLNFQMSEAGRTINKPFPNGFDGLRYKDQKLPYFKDRYEKEWQAWKKIGNEVEKLGGFDKEPGDPLLEKWLSYRNAFRVVQKGKHKVSYDKNEFEDLMKKRMELEKILPKYGGVTFTIPAPPKYPRGQEPQPNKNKNKRGDTSKSGTGSPAGYSSRANEEQTKSDKRAYQQTADSSTFAGLGGTNEFLEGAGSTAAKAPIDIGMKYDASCGDNLTSQVPKMYQGHMKEPNRPDAVNNVMRHLGDIQEGRISRINTLNSRDRALQRGQTANEVITYVATLGRCLNRRANGSGVYMDD